MALKTNIVLALLAAAITGGVSFVHAATAETPPAPPPCDANLEVCDVINPATGKPRVWPKDVAKFQADVETCIHFAGEEPYDAARRREINAAVRKHCGPAERNGAPLRKKYAKNPLVLNRVNAIQALKESAL